ncbi:FecR domain-containing protein [Mesorhizobium sp. CAU 1732]|uniref:FecR domain-containing protein n=1 Tax=Mesorhizobium sp. CAU 1732 TaxID=3140358 RepID=UPI0032602E44
MRVPLAALLAVLVPFGTSMAFADILPRGTQAAGSVIARKSGEEVRFIDVGDWRTVDVSQDLLAGDVLRTNAIGHLAVLFSDRTQLRLGRNTTLLVKRVGDTSDSVFGLEGGSVWGRAETGGIGLTVETPAAAAAIRGTDFSLNVDGDRTSLIVLDGNVDLANEFGSVSVSAGESAVARIGQAPTKVVIVNPDDREQMLYYLTLRNAFTFLPASTLRIGDMRGAQTRVETLDESARSAEDWVSLAETSLSIKGWQEAQIAVTAARRQRLSETQSARLDLVEAMIAGSQQRYRDAAALFARALPALDSQRRSIATYGGYFARALADPKHAEDPPAAVDGPYGALADAYAAGFLRDITAAIDVLIRAEARYPDDPSLPAVRAQFALLMDDRAQVREAIERALRLDPENPTALEARANYRADVEGDLDGALDDLNRAAALAPGSTSIWNALGLLQSARDANREAEAALKRSIALDPADPVSYANLAILYLDQDRIKEAKAMIDRAMEVDPTFDLALIARGRYHLQTSEMDKARADLLAGTTANPAYAQGVLLLGSAHYESGDREPADQAIRNAERLDPNDPVTASMRAAIAIDDYDAEAAIDNAQETVRRSRARGGDYAGLSANREAGSLLGSAFRLQGLDAWGRFYGDVVFSPFSGSALVDQAVSGSPDPFATSLEPGVQPVDPGTTSNGFSSLFQGLMFSPELISGRARSANLFSRPFVEGALGGGFISSDNGKGWTANAEVQAFATSPIPWSLYGNLTTRRSDEFRERIEPGTPIPYTAFDLSSDLVSGIGYLTARPTPNDRVVAYADIDRAKPSLSNGVELSILPVSYNRDIAGQSIRGGLGWSHTFGHENVLNAAVFASDVDQSSAERRILFNLASVPIALLDTDREFTQSTYLAALNHTVSTGDMAWRYGVEAGSLTQTQATTELVITGGGITTTTDAQAVDARFARAYLDGIWEIRPDLRAEAALFGTYLAGDLDIQRLEPRVGLSWSPLDGHWLTTGFMRETNGINETTLSPIGIAGLQPNQAPMDIGGLTDTFAARWNAEWTDRIFTSLDYQHQELDGLSISTPAGLASYSLSEGRIDRVSATANVRLGYGLGVFGTIAIAQSRNLDPTSAGFGLALPFVPETSARIGATFVHPSNVKLTLAGTYIGERLGSETEALPSYWTVDAFATWEPFDKRFALELGAYNLLDETFEVETQIPGWGRTFTGSLKVRF